MPSVGRTWARSCSIIYMTENTYILQIETATSVCSVVISRNGETVAEVEANEPNLHASHLTVFIEQTIEKAAITLSDIAAVAVSKGPGSYTGLRIGTSTAKGLCYALDIPLISVNTLEAMAHGFEKQIALSAIARHTLVPMIDARRMEVYMATYSPQLECLTATEARIIDTYSFSSNYKNPNYVLFGTGADKLATLFEKDAAIHVATGFRNAASFFSTLALQKFEQQEFEDIVYFEPYYLKDFIATTPRKRP